jgi:hypothetical protein
MTEGIAEAVAELRGTKCRCGLSKPSGNTFCRECYWQLPQPLRRALYHRVDNGYMEAYTAAVEYLDALKGLGV